MKQSTIVAALLALLVLVVACPRPGTPPAPEDASSPPSSAGDAASGDACARACANLRDLGCVEGSDSSCAAVCRTVTVARLTSLRPECIAGAPSKEAVRACGGIACKP